MGYYTKFTVDFVLSPANPDWVLPLLRYMALMPEFRAPVIERHYGEPYIPEEERIGPCWQAPPIHEIHPLFMTTRWACCFAYGDPANDRRFETTPQGVHVRIGETNAIKNYEGVIEKFSHWIRPYLQPQEKPFLVSVNEDHYWKRWFTDGRAEDMTERWLHDYRAPSYLGSGFGGFGEPEDEEDAKEQWRPISPDDTQYYRGW